MTTEEYKKKVKDLFIAHLKTKGYPNMTNEQILAELKPLYILLEENNLKLPGLTFTSFQNIATQIATQLLFTDEELEDMIKKNFRVFF